MNGFQAGDEVIVAGVYFDFSGSQPYLSRATVLLPEENVVRFSYGPTRELCSAESAHRTKEEAFGAIESRIRQHAERLVQQVRDIKTRTITTL